MFRKGIALVVMLLFVGMCIIPSTGKIAEEIPHNTFDGSVLLDINGTMGENGWYISPIWISFEYDPEIILEIWLSITKDPEPNWIMYEEPFLFGGEGIWVFQYKWLDIWGNGTCSEPIIIKIDYTPPDIEEVEWETFQEPPIFGIWYCKFTCNAVDNTSGMDRVEMYINDGEHEIIHGSGPIYEFIIATNWFSFTSSTFNFFHYDFAGNSAFDSVNGSDIKSHFRSQSSSQQSYSILNSQSEISVIPSTGKIDVATSRTTFNDGTLSGYVNNTSMNPIGGALVRVYFHGTYEENYTNSSGYYHVTNIPICYCLKNATCSKEGYKTEWVLLSIDENTTHDFILMDNHPPSAPEIEGPTVKPVPRPLPKVGEPWNYTFKSTDPDGDDVYYWIEWDDGTASGWIGPYASGEEVVVSHTWSEKGTYIIMAKAKDIYGAESDWGTLDVIMPKNQQVSNMWFLRWLERFPLLQRLLSLPISNSILKVGQ